MSRSLACFIPPYLLREIARRNPEESDRVARTLAVDTRIRALRGAPRPVLPQLAAGPAWVVRTAAQGYDLPGTVVRTAGEPEAGDLAVDEAAHGLAATLALFDDVYARSSWDGRGASAVAVVHYGQDYENAAWHSEHQVVVFGDGGRFFERLTKPVDVVAHEFAHAVTEHSAGLVYRGQSGALNESVSDVFAACLKQRLLGQDATEGDWLIGEGLFRPGVSARALRDMAEPGTAFDDPAFGRDQQVAHLDDYDDDADVHLTSGIPNRAFHLAATGIGGSSAEGAGRIWYAALTDAQVGAATDFAGFAAATVAAAGEHADVVRSSWAAVGVTPDGAGRGATTATPEPGPDPGPDSGHRVTVRRTGGFAGRTSAGAVDLEQDDTRALELAALVDRVDLGGVAGGAPHPDMYLYDFDLCGARASVPEHHLTADLRRIAELVLEGD